ncbi:MAG: fumarylacetoacetate hydrolase family protein [Gammaproteobacteria bacterium]|nr:fumarylacetoacetate hydrolase family protein [Gammaproteobacteria bacterium]
MKLVSYKSTGEQVHLGALKGNHIVNLHHASAGELPDDMLEFLKAGEVAMQAANNLQIKAGDGINADSVKLLSPVTNPSKIIAIGLNYMDHIREADIGVPELATMFCKYPSAIIGTDAEIHWSSTLTQQVDYEAELAVVIGKMAKDVSEANAYDYVAGYMNCNDVSARDLQFRPGDQWLRGKCLDSFCPLGPYLITSDEIDDPHNLSIKCMLNGQLMQDSSTREMIYRIPYLIEYLSEAFTLLPGDVIATGTPHGVGAFRDPPIWLGQGDVVSVEVEGLGSLTNRCVVSD